MLTAQLLEALSAPMAARAETVAIQFTDLVGATELLQRAGDVAALANSDVAAPQRAAPPPAAPGPNAAGAPAVGV